MQPFKTLRSPPLPYVGANVDTDQILPARFLSRPRAGGFSQYLFHDLRFDDEGTEQAEFILNKLAYKEAHILVGEENFGCGSSRENAVWAVSDYGFRVVVAQSFGDIFFSNSLKNGLLPVVLPPDAVASILASAIAEPGLPIEVDLAAQTVTDQQGAVHAFEIDAFSKHCLLNGEDELDYTLAQIDKITAFERTHLLANGWSLPTSA